jgi:two-component system sensor histidine kinase/response regulator
MSDTASDRYEQVRILIVEDDHLQADTLACILTAASFDVDTVSDGLSAVLEVRERFYDVVLMDYQLPEIDGFAAARLIGDFLEGLARPVVIALTATPEQLNARESGAASAFDAILAKSSDLTGLFVAIAHCLASAPERTTRQKAIFSLLLKSWANYDTAPDHPGAWGDDAGPARILVIDDDEAQRRLLISLLEQRNYVVETAFDGLDAVWKICNGCYDLALVEYGLPKMDGLAVGTVIHDTMGEDERPRLIGLTATATLLSEKEGTTRGVFDEIFQKSSDLPGLLCAVDRHMRASPNPATRRAAAYSNRKSRELKGGADYATLSPTQ